MAHIVFAHQAVQDVNGLLLFPLVKCGVDNGGCQHLAGGIHHRHLAAVAVAGVQAHGNEALDRGLHQQGLQVQGKIVNGAFIGTLAQVAADLTLDGGEDQPLVGILGSSLDKLGNKHGGLQCRSADQSRTLVARQGHTGLQDPFLLTPIDGQDLVIQQPGYGLGEVIVQPVHGVRIRILGLAGKYAPAGHQTAQILPDLRIIGKILSDDIAGTLESFFNGIDTLLRVDVILCKNGRILTVLGEDSLRQRCQALLPGHGATGAALLLVGPVQILHLGHGGRIVDSGGQLLCQLALIFDGTLYLVTALLEVPQIGQPGLQIAQGGVVHGTVHFLPVPGNKGNGVALVDQGHHIFNILQFLAQFFRQNFSNQTHWVSPCPKSRQVS